MATSTAQRGTRRTLQTISGYYTGLSRPYGIAVDPVNGDIYVANGFGGSTTAGSITVYAPGSNGNVPPLAEISGSSTGLKEPAGLALDASGDIYVPNVDNNSITV